MTLFMLKLMYYSNLYAKKKNEVDGLLQWMIYMISLLDDTMAGVGG
jgi:hypothetical protein